MRKSDYAWYFEIETYSVQYTPKAIQAGVVKALKGTKKVDLDGNH